MSLVVSHSGPVHYLVLCDAIEVVPMLYGHLVIPASVVRELIHPRAPRKVSRWIQTRPPWTTIQTPLHIDPAMHLGLGEREANYRIDPDVVREVLKRDTARSKPDGAASQT